MAQRHVLLFFAPVFQTWKYLRWHIFSSPSSFSSKWRGYSPRGRPKWSKVDHTCMKILKNLRFFLVERVETVERMNFYPPPRKKSRNKSHENIRWLFFFERKMNVFEKDNFLWSAKKCGAYFWTIFLSQFLSIFISLFPTFILAIYLSRSLSISFSFPLSLLF